MSMKEAAKLANASEDTVRRWIDEAETAGRPVAERERDESGQPVKGRHRRPYREAVEAWARRRRPAASAEE
ncbi:hypothetical protein [Micromonospora sp. RP3T]|uniref:hypothetical protein n=1 Tax=Micromonospora sp. RP3T TaxID=2135446 RepID=UPI003D7504E7